MVKTVAKTAADALSAAAEATALVRREIEAGREAIKVKRAESKAATSAPLPKADVEARVRGEVQMRGASFTSTRAAFLFSGLAYESGKRGPGRGLNVVEGADDLLDLLCAGAPDLACQIVLAALGKFPHAPAAGLPSAERAAAAERILSEIAALEVEDESRTDAALEAGLPGIEHRPEVLKRRAAAADALAREDGERAKMAGRVRLLDQNYDEAVGAEKPADPGPLFTKVPPPARIGPTTLPDGSQVTPLDSLPAGTRLR